MQGSVTSDSQRQGSKMTDKASDLTETLNAIREEEYQEIPPELINEIVQIEQESLEDREQTQDRISDLVESYLEE